MSNFPEKLWDGKTAPWYIVTRLANKENYGEDGKGDRLLNVYQGDSTYLFATQSNEPTQFNKGTNVNSIADIEGVWTYVYFSYSKDLNRAVGLFRQQTQTIQRTQFDLTHPEATALKFVVAGAQLGFPGFHG